MIHLVFHKELKLVQDEFLMEKCWESHWELQAEIKLVLMKDQGCFYQEGTLRLIGLVNLREQVLDRVILWVFHKEQRLEINRAYTMVECRVSHSEL